MGVIAGEPSIGADARAKALSALARFHVRDTTLAEALQRIAEITLEAIPSATAAGITMLGDDGRPTTAVYTDTLSPEIDAAQYRDGRGPCLDAWRQSRVVRIRDLDKVSDEYPAFVAACRDHDVRSTLSVPILAGDVSSGALNLYAQASDAFDDDDEAVVADLAGAAGSVLTNVSAYLRAFEMSESLAKAMESRAVIEQAKGMLMAHSPNLSADDAFELLRRASQRENVKLREIARRIVERQVPPAAETEQPPA